MYVEQGRSEATCGKDILQACCTLTGAIALGPMRSMCYAGGSSSACECAGSGGLQSLEPPPELALWYSSQPADMDVGYSQGASLVLPTA